jgi:hypothetical protein
MPIHPLRTKSAKRWQRNVDILCQETWLMDREDVYWTDYSLQTLAVRVPGYVFVDFYPSSGRWRIAKSGSHSTEGGAREFWLWFLNPKRTNRRK